MNTTGKNTQHYFLFTGHMIDKPGRKAPRFPADKEPAVTKKLKEILAEEKEKTNASITGISGGACGADIIFHELCGELNIPSELYLALPREEYIQRSVAFAGQDWVRRFDELYARLPVQLLQTTGEDETNIWERNNIWLLNSAMVNGGENMTLIALWDGKGGDGPGGTEHMVEVSSKSGAKVIIIDMNSI